LSHASIALSRLVTYQAYGRLAGLLAPIQRVDQQVHGRAPRVCT
jgi:hypothetical protein